MESTSKPTLVWVGELDLTRISFVKGIPETLLAEVSDDHVSDYLATDLGKCLVRNGLIRPKAAQNPQGDLLEGVYGSAVGILSSSAADLSDTAEEALPSGFFGAAFAPDSIAVQRNAMSIKADPDKPGFDHRFAEGLSTAAAIHLIDKGIVHISRVYPQITVRGLVYYGADFTAVSERVIEKVLGGPIVFEMSL